MIDGQKDGWRTLTDLSEVHSVAHALGERDPVLNNLISSLMLRLQEVRPVFVREENSNEVAYWSDKNLVLSTLSFDGLLPLAHRFEGVQLPGVVGPLEPAEGFVEAYAAVVGVRPRKWLNQMLFQCNSLIEPRSAAGSARPLEVSDRDWFVSGMVDFIREALPHEAFDPARFTTELPVLAGSRRFHVWEVAGKPSAFAALSGSTPWSQRIGPVYTLPEFRGKGYGSAITAHLTRMILETGRIPCLYTDLSNSASNSIYPKLGYREVAPSLQAVYGD